MALRLGWAVAALACVCAVPLAQSVPQASVQADEAALLAAGRRIYDEGVLISGEPLRAVRLGGTVVSGADAACRLCHQRSGMGLTEGSVPVPPVTGPALFGKLELATYGRAPRRAPGMRYTDFHFKTRAPYTEASLAATLRQGVTPAGHRFAYMMPSYDLGEADMAALIAYLRQLSAGSAPGADGREMHFATVIASDVDALRRRSFTEVLQTCFDDKFAGGSDAPEASASQRWQLHRWQLEGAPQTWQAQLQARYAAQPVFALVSGLAGETWAPVQAFCEAQGLPCLFPNADAPGTGGRYSFYFFRGVGLEAEVAAGHLLERRQALGLKRVVQISRREGAGAVAADALEAALAGSPLALERRVWPSPEAAADPTAQANLLADLGAGDALLLWLREADLALLDKALPAPPQAGLILVSGVLGGQENTPLGEAWRRRLLMTYPYDPPQRWNRRMDFNLRTWLAQKGIARGDERMQGNTLAACNLLTEGVLRLRGQYLRDYLVEATENYPTQMGNAPAPQAFPRFSLGPGQRFSSKGAYLVRFADAVSRRLTPEGDWIVP